MKSRRCSPVKVGLFWNILRPKFISHTLFKIPYCICYENNAYYSDKSTKQLASYTKRSRWPTKITETSIFFKHHHLHALKPTTRIFDINIRLNEFSEYWYCCFYQNKVKYFLQFLIITNFVSNLCSFFCGCTQFAPHEIIIDCLISDLSGIVIILLWNRLRLRDEFLKSFVFFYFFI